jgi:TalC/MipB family fructose-6-phosphate aldolase
MKLYVDIADANAIKYVASFYPLDGFTTNPQILTKAGHNITNVLNELKEIIETTDMTIFVQVTAENAEKMLEQAKALHDYFGKTFVVKLPMTKEGIRAVTLCKSSDITVTVTIIFSVTQALIAAKAGADYVAPYVNRIENIGSDGIKTVTEMVNVLENQGYNTKVLAASFKNANQVKGVVLVGCQAITITPEMFDQMIYHPYTDKSLIDFKKYWETSCGSNQIDDYIPR